MERILEQVWAERDDDLTIETPYEALIMASLIERETGAPEERREIAGVFKRRMERGMRLQTDPTVIYAIKEFDGNIRKKDLNIDGVIGKEKIQSFAKADVDYVGLETIYGRAYRADNETIENSAFIDVDKSKYLAGTKKALGKFLSFHTQEFAEKTK